MQPAIRTLRWRRLRRSEQLMLLTGWVLKGIIASILVTSLGYGEWLWTFGASIVLLSSFVPAMVERSFKVVLPLEFDTFITTFLVFSYVLGNIHGFYEFFPWWDTALHFISGLFLAFTGFVIVYVLYEVPKVNVRLSPAFVSLFSFCFSLALGALWEIVEFVADALFETGMQPGLGDTMWDLIIDATSALLMAGIAYIYVRSPQKRPIERLLRRADMHK